MMIKWNTTKRFVFLCGVLVGGVLCALLAYYLTVENFAYNWRSVNDFNRWKNWNLVLYLIGATVMYIPFWVVMRWHRSNLAQYAVMKQQRVVYVAAGSFIIFLLALGTVLICAFFNPHIGETIVEAYLALFLVSAFYALILVLSLAVNGKLGLWYW